MNRRKFLSLCGLATIAGAFPVGAFAAHGLASGGVVRTPPPSLVGNHLSYPMSLPPMTGGLGPEWIGLGERIKAAVAAVEESRERGFH